MYKKIQIQIKKIFEQELNIYRVFYEILYNSSCITVPV